MISKFFITIIILTLIQRLSKQVEHEMNIKQKELHTSNYSCIEISIFTKLKLTRLCLSFIIIIKFIYLKGRMPEQKESKKETEREESKKGRKISMGYCTSKC